MVIEKHAKENFEEDVEEEFEEDVEELAFEALIWDMQAVYIATN